jgi:hypothetical protein
MVLASLFFGLTAAAVADPPARHLESWRLRSGAAYVGTVVTVRRLGALDGLTGETQGRMEAAVRIVKVLRAPARTAPPQEAPVRFDSRAPQPEGGGFYTLAPGEAVLVFADGFEPAYPRELLHGTPVALAAETQALRDFVATMDADTMRLHGLTAATRASQVRLYEEALATIARLPAAR